jgi:subtilisin family serine protease
MMLLASIPSLAFADVTPQAPDKKVKFLVKHADNERLRAMFYPEETTVSDGTVILPDQPVESVEQPPIEEPATEEPATEEPVEEEQAAPVDESIVEEPTEEESAAPVEEPLAEEPTEEESATPVEEPAAEEPAEEEPAAPVEESAAEEPAEEEPAAPVEEPAAEEPAEEEPTAPVEEPAAEEPAEEEPAAPVASELLCEEVTNDLMLVEATYEEIQALLEDPDVYAVEVDAEVHITEEIMPGNLVAIGMDQIQDESFQGQGIKVAILDTGIDVENTDLNLAGGVSFVESDSIDDTNGHGTALAGIINAQINNEGLIGMAPQAELYAVKVLDSTGTGYYSDVIQGLVWCEENRMDIVVMSFGADQYSGILHESVQGMYYQDGLMIAAAGNTTQVQYPAAYPEVMAVGGVDETGLPTYAYANADLVDLYALGTGIESYDMNQGQTFYSGTSFSAAEAAGAAAALWSYDPVKTNDMVRASLVSSCTPEDPAASPILEMLPVYNDAVNGVVVDPGDNTGEVDPDENPDAEVNASEVVSGQDVFGNDQPIHFSVKFSNDHDIVEAATKDGGTVLDTDSVSNVVGGFEGGAYTGQSYDFDFAPIPYKGNYIADFKPKSLNEETGEWQIEYPFDEPFAVIQPDLVPTITHVNLGEVVVDEATDSLHQDPLVKVTVQVKNVDEYRYQGDVTVKAYLEKQNENLQTIRILLDSVTQNRTIQSNEIVDYVLAWDPIANNDGEYAIVAEVVTSNGNYEPSGNNED